MMSYFLIKLQKVSPTLQQCPDYYHFTAWEFFTSALVLMIVNLIIIIIIIIIIIAVFHKSSMNLSDSMSSQFLNTVLSKLSDFNSAKI